MKNWFRKLFPSSKHLGKQNQLERTRPDYEGALYHILANYCELEGNNYEGVKKLTAQALNKKVKDITIINDKKNGLHIFADQLFRPSKKISAQLHKTIVEKLLNKTILGEEKTINKAFNNETKHPLLRALRAFDISSSIEGDFDGFEIKTTPMNL